MKSRPSRSAFTLIEIVVALAVLIILAGLVIRLSSHGAKHSSRVRAAAEIALIKAACESYKADVGHFPQDFSGGLNAPGVTDKLKPKEHFIPMKNEYEDANLFLYKELTGDKNADTKPGADEPKYLKEFDPRLLKADRDSENRIVRVRYLQDPFDYGRRHSAISTSPPAVNPQERRSRRILTKRRSILQSWQAREKKAFCFVLVIRQLHLNGLLAQSLLKRES